MAYLRCTHCGSKALVAASQCPKCAKPFNLLDGRGERAKLKQCRSCGIMHRADTHCHWCGEVKSVLTLPKLSAATLKSAAGVALMLSVAGGAWRFAPQLRDVVMAMQDTAQLADASEVTPPLAPRPETVASGAAATTGTPAPSVSDTVALSASQDASATIATGDAEIRWVPAVARTWVNVRADASRGGEVVGVIKPASRAMLGTDRAGWRQVKSTEVSGWVDPRLFEPDSLRTRGDEY
ncbi:hypothetical protein [Gemmatimonas sp.]